MIVLGDPEIFALVIVSTLIALSLSPIIWRLVFSRVLSSANPLAGYVNVKRRRDAARLVVFVLKATACVLLALYASQPLTVEEMKVENTVNVSGVIDVERLVGTPLVLTLDVSGSMLFESKLDMAREAARTLTMGLPNGFKVGYVAFSDIVKVVVPPTNNRSRILEALNSTVSGGGTLYGPALSAVENLLRPYTESNLTGHVVLLSDGAPSDNDFWPLVDALARNGVRIHAVYIGEGERGMEILGNITRMTGGIFVAATPSQLLDALSSIGKQIENMTIDTQVEVKVSTVVMTERALNAPYLQVVVLLLVVAWLFTAYRYRTAL